MKYAIRHQAAGILPERYEAPPPAALVSAAGEALEPFFGPKHPKTGKPWWLRVEELADDAPGNEQVHSRCTKMLAHAAAMLAAETLTLYRWRRIAIAALVALAFSCAGMGYSAFESNRCQEQRR